MSTNTMHVINNPYENKALSKTGSGTAINRIGMRYPGDFYYQSMRAGENNMIMEGQRYAGDFYRSASLIKAPVLTCMKGSSMRFASDFYNKCA